MMKRVVMGIFLLGMLGMSAVGYAMHERTSLAVDCPDPGCTHCPHHH
jgi:hypothetical protein